MCVRDKSLKKILKKENEGEVMCVSWFVFFVCFVLFCLFVFCAWVDNGLILELF